MFPPDQPALPEPEPEEEEAQSAPPTARQKYEAYVGAGAMFGKSEAVMRKMYQDRFGAIPEAD